VVRSEAFKLGIEPKLESWLGRTQIKRRTVPEGQQAWDCRVASYLGEMVKVLEMSYEGLSQLLFRNHSKTLTIAIGSFGHFKGSAGGRPFGCVPNRLSFLLLPEEVLKLVAGSTRIAGLVIQVPEPLLIQECIRQDTPDPDLLTLGDTLPGQEALLLACSQQLLRLAQKPDHLNCRLSSCRGHARQLHGSQAAARRPAKQPAIPSCPVLAGPASRVHTAKIRRTGSAGRSDK